MSTKRGAVLVAKDCRLLSNQTKNYGNSIGFQDYKNINLNQNYSNFVAVQNGQFESKNYSDNIFKVLLTTTVGVDKIDYKNNQAISNLWNKNDSSKSNLYSQNNYYFQKKDKNIFGKNLNKSSTLSLHIEAYENAAAEIEAQKMVGNNLKESKQNTFVNGGWKKNIHATTIQDFFAFPRQQQQKEEKESMEAAEVMAFKFSNRLMNLNGLKDKQMLLASNFGRRISSFALKPSCSRLYSTVKPWEDPWKHALPKQEQTLTDFKESSIDWSYVERLLPKETIPPMPMGGGVLPSGWRPPMNPPPPLPYFIGRDRKHQPSLYLERRRDQLNLDTMDFEYAELVTMYEVSGDMFECEKDLKEFLENQLGHPVATYVDEIKGRIKVKGAHRSLLEKFIFAKGF